MKDLLDSSEKLKAAQLIADSLDEKINDITVQFFHNLNILLRKKTKLETVPYDRDVDIYLKEFSCRKRTYVVTLFIDIDTYLEACVGFCEISGVTLLRLDEAEKRFPSIYKEWIEKLDSLEGIPKLKRWTHSRYFLLENSRGAQLNFKDQSAQIELIAEMDQQCKYICDSIVDFVITPLLAD